MSTKIRMRIIKDTYIIKFSSTRISQSVEGQNMFWPLFSVKIFVIRYSFQQNWQNTCPHWRPVRNYKER